MSANFKTIFNAIETAIKSDVPEIVWLDWDLGQLEETTPPISWPAVLIDIPETTYTNLGELQQIGQPTIQLRVVFERVDPSHFNRTVETAFTHFEILDKVVKSLHGLEGTTFNGMVRTTLKREIRSDHYEYVIGFTCALYDDYSENEYTMTPMPGMEIESSF